MKRQPYRERDRQRRDGCSLKDMSRCSVTGAVIE